MWEKAPQCFEEHQQTHCHKCAASYDVVIPKCKDVGETNNDNLVTCVKKKESIYLMWSGIYDILQGKELLYNEMKIMITLRSLMMLLGTKDESIIAHLDRIIGNKYTHHDTQNELLNIMSHHVLLSKLETIRKFLIFFQ